MSTSSSNANPSLDQTADDQVNATRTPSAFQPLQGIRVLEFTHAVMGPAAGLILAEMGAEVIHIEPVHGEEHTHHHSHSKEEE